MARRKIVWTQKANEERKEILAYWIERNQSKTFSVKLNKLIKETLLITAFYPDTGRKTTIEKVRVKIIRDYFLFYEANKTTLVVLAIWDGRRNDKALNIK
jgi:toxin YoeB